MAENPSLPLALAESPQTPRRGRPRGARNKSSSDLKRWIEHSYGGQTPGQQLASICMLTPADIRQAKREIKERGLRWITPAAYAMAERARELAPLIGRDRGDAMAILVKANAEVLPYIHQRQAQAEPVKADGAKTFVIGMPDPSFNPMIHGEIAAAPTDADALENAGLFDGMPEQVSQPKSHEQT